MLRIGAVVAWCLGLCLLAPAAIAATVRIDTAGGLDPQVIFEGGGGEDAGRAGANVLRFSGRIGGKRLRPGRYRLVATPQGGVPVRVLFSVRP